MKSFFKYILASIFGVLISMILLFFIFLGIISAIIASQDKPVHVEKNSILTLQLNQPIHDRKSPLPVFVYNLSALGANKQIGLNDLLNNVDKARRDTNIRGIFLDITYVDAGMATLEEIRGSLASFRQSGKFIVAFGSSFSQGAYYLASIADYIYLNPGGSVNFVGLSAELMFYKNTLEKLDIRPEIIRHGKFKSALEPFMYEKMSAENREQIKTYMGSIWNHMVDQISESRNISADSLNLFADRLLMWDNQAAIRTHLIDTLLYRDQVMDTLARLVGTSRAKDLTFITHSKYLRVPKPHNSKGYSRDKIAVIYAEGSITTTDAGEGSINADRMATTIREARQDSSVKAIVFRINSGGGSALASEMIWRELYLARQVKPVVASLGDVAASGGYYIVAAADTIITNHHTLTGSIGVFGLLLDASGFMKNKLGITTDVEKTNTSSDFGSPFRPLSPGERFTLQKMIDEAYATFVQRVASGRDTTTEAIDRIGEGRVWSGINSKELGLTDATGGLTEAIAIAARMAKLENYRISELPRQQDAVTQLMNELSGEMKQSVLKKELGDAYRYYEHITTLSDSDPILARIPFDLLIH